jgi:hypothetical protein
MPRSGGCGPSHLSSAPALGAGPGPQHAPPAVPTSEARTGDAAILCFQELKANYKNRNERGNADFRIYCIMPDA